MTLDLLRDLFGVNVFDAVGHFPSEQPAVPPVVTDEDDLEYGLNRYIEIPSRGLCLCVTDDDKVQTVQVYGEGCDPDYACFTDDLPFKLTIRDNREVVRRKLSSSDIVSSGVGMHDGPWDLFRTDDCDLNITFDKDSLITLFISIQVRGLFD